MASRRFLAAQARSGNGHGYLSQPDRPYPIVADEPEVVEQVKAATAMCDEPEAPSPAWVDAESELAAERNRLRLLREAELKREARKGVSFESRVADAERRAKVKRWDSRMVSTEMLVVRKMWVRGSVGAATRRLERFEARLDGVFEETAA